MKKQKQGDVFPDEKEKKEKPKDKWQGKYFVDKDTITPDQIPEYDGVLKVSELSKEAPKEATAKKNHRGRSQVERREKQQKNTDRAIMAVRFFVIVLISAALAFGGAFLAAFANGEGFRLIRHWPILASAFVFALSTIAFFSVHYEKERMYGIFSAISAACIVVELIMMFS